jgi:HAD superfamily hydrolase (TIGR01484 family)
MDYKKPKIVFSDFDGTLTYGSRLISAFFDIIKILEDNKTPLIIITGRSLSWGHFLLSHFPYLKHVITEGGGNLISVNERGLLEQEFLVGDDELERLAVVVEMLIDRFPEIELSADSFGRKSDRAIELRDLSDPSVKQDVEAFMDEHNINHSTSNVHLNFWCGDISKANSYEHYMKKYGDGVSSDEVVFFGDSLNDQTLFKLLPNSVGVANISEVLDVMTDKPSIILKGEGNIGPYGVINHLKDIYSN